MCALCVQSADSSVCTRGPAPTRVLVHLEETTPRRQHGLASGPWHFGERPAFVVSLRVSASTARPCRGSRWLLSSARLCRGPGACTAWAGGGPAAISCSTRSAVLQGPQELPPPRSAHRGSAEPGLQGWEALQVTSKAPGTLAATARQWRCPCTALGLGMDGLAAPPSRGAASPVLERHHQSGFFQHGVGEDGRVARPHLARPPHPLRPAASSVPGHMRQLVASSAAAFAKLPKPGA